MTVPHRLSFSAQLSNCNLATCWHIELSILGLLHLSISINFSNSFSCSMKFNRKTLMSSVYFFLCPWEGFPRQTCNNHLRRKQGCELMDQIQTVVWQLLRQPWEELVPWERTLWHWSKHVKFSPSRLFHTGCLSLHSCQTAILPHVGTLNSAYWAFSTFQSAFISAIALVVPWNSTEKHWCPVSTFSYVRGKAFLGKPATITFGENKDVNSWIKFRLLYDNSFAPALGGACAMGTNTIALIQTCQIQAIMTVPHRLSFSAQLSNCNLATCWHIELSILGLLHLSISIHFSNSFSCSMKF